MKKAFITIASVFIIIGVIGVAFNLIFGVNTASYLIQRDINGYYLYEVDIWNYVNNIRNSIQDTAELTLRTPTTQWNNTTPDISNFGTLLAYNLKVLFNYFLMFLNVFLYPIRVGGYLVKNIYTILGLNVTNPPSNIQWFIDLFNSVISLQIPYIP